MQSLGLFVGIGECNANCKHCAGRVHRKDAPKKDGDIDKELILKTLKETYGKGARYLSLSSSGEPTLSPLSVTKILELVSSLTEENKKFSNINLYSNGIIIGQDEEFCEKYLLKWKQLGLTSIYLTVHSINEDKNAEIYGINKYPQLSTIVNRIHKYGLLIRANIILSKGNIATCEQFIYIVKQLQKLNFNSVSSWRIRDQNDNVDLENSPLESELDKMEKFIEENKFNNFDIKIMRGQNQVLYQTKQKLTLFPSGILSNTWCN